MDRLPFTVSTSHLRSRERNGDYDKSHHGVSSVLSTEQMYFIYKFRDQGFHTTGLIIVVIVEIFNNL